MEMDNVFLVPPGSRLATAAGVGRAGVRVAVPRGNAPDPFLTRTCRTAASWPGCRPARARVLEERFNVVRMATLVPKGRGAAELEHLGRFVAEMRRDGTMTRAIERAGLRSARVHRPDS